MHYEHESGGASFDLPDRMTVREQLAFRAKLSGPQEGGAFVRYWHAAPSILTNWQSDLIPDMAALDLDATTDGRLTEIVVWVGTTIAGHVVGLETPPKNS